jgi:hypothetical protein
MRCAVRAVSGLSDKTYKERLCELTLPSLEDRRIEADMAMTHKVISDSEKR